MKRLLFFFLLLFFVESGVSSQIVKWTFETSIPANSGPHAAEIGTGSATGLHADGAAVYTSPVGNGSAHSFSSNRWTIGDYYQFQFNTTGYQDISITWDATGSSTGPRDFKVQYSTDGTVFTDATGINSTYQLTGESWSSTTYNPASTRTLDLSFVTVLNNNATVYIRLAVTSSTSIGGGAVGTAGTSRVDDFTVNGSLIPANTITITGLSSTTFNLADCFATASGTVDFISTDVFNGGNIFTAQLSDASGSFATPTNIGSLAGSGTAPGGTISITIPNGTASGTLYKIRIVSSDPVAYSNLSADITINQFGTCVSLATDFFRSKADGSWNSNSTWESSPTGVVGTWIPATMTPTSTANTITIRNTHTVTITLAVTIDQVVIENGGVLVHSVGVLTINDDASGDDVIVQSGGVFTLSFLNNPPVFSPATASANINTGGILRVSVGGMTAPGAGVNASNYFYQDASILELTTAFSTAGVTYFPNVNATTIPVFRTTGILSVGANTTTTFNGVFEANSSITFLNTGDKIFRNGIRGTGNINGSTSGTFFITGQTAELGGAGSLILPATGLQIGSVLNATTVSLISDKTITGDLSLLSTNNTYVDLSSYNLIVTGTITGGALNAFVKTSGAGALTLNAIAPSAFKDFPIGNTSYNPLRITNDILNSASDFTARVDTGINNPSVAFPTHGVRRTWYINAPSSISNIIVRYQYAAADLGIYISPADLVEILQSDYTTWSIITGNTGIPQVGSDPYTVTTTTALTINNTAVPYAIGKNGGWILPVDYFITTRAQKINNTGIIKWVVTDVNNVRSFEVQRSVNNSGFRAIGTVDPVANQTDFSFTDAALSKGTNLYRIKVNRLNGPSKYSNTVAVINDSKGLFITSLAPNPVMDKAAISIASARATAVQFAVYDMRGNIVMHWYQSVPEGSSNPVIDLGRLPAGVYYLSATGNENKTVMSFIRQ